MKYRRGNSFTFESHFTLLRYTILNTVVPRCNFVLQLSAINNMIFDDFPLYRVPYPWRDNHPISRFTLAIQQRHRSEIPNRVEEKNFFPLLSFFTFFLSFPFFLLHRPREIGKGFSLRDPKKRWIYGPIKRSLSLLFKEEHYSINEEMKFFPFFFSFFLMEILQDSSRRFLKNH